ncbi:hypothetical protein HET69_06040 [Streptomyces sp. CJ_13]|nr:hypothetical protein [Streptomyces sp. CJ_13]
MTEPQAGCGQTSAIEAVPVDSRQVLEPTGAVRLSVDEVVHDRYGRYGVWDHGLWPRRNRDGS